MKKIIKKIRKLKLWYKKVLISKNDYKIPFFTKIKYALKGFSGNEYILYNLKENDYTMYESEFERIQSRQIINGDYKFILDDKLIFEEIFRNYIRVPKTYAWISNGNIYGMHEFDINNDNFIDFIKEKKDVVLKWENGYEGKGTYVIKYIEKSKFIINHEEKNINDLKKVFSYYGTAILSEYIEQSKFSNELYPNSTNTIRIICAKKKNEKYAKIYKAVQRIGNNYSKPVDNFCAGGFASEIDIQTGELQEIISKNPKAEYKLKLLKEHPDTGNIIYGKKIPNWEKIKKEITDLTNKFPYLNLIAWDVLLTEEGICIIEANASSSCDLLQMKHGIKNEEYGEMLESYGVFKK